MHSAVRHHERAILVVVLLLGLLVRLPLAPVDFHTTTDLGTYRRWAEAAQTLGLAGLYGGAHADYPPLVLYLLAGAGWVAHHLTAGFGDREAWLTALIKVPSLLADVVMAGLIAWVWRGRSSAMGIVAASAYVLNPAVWYVSAHWGQTDALYTLLLVGAAVALERGAITPAWLLFALALGTKLQSLAIAPLVIVATLRRYGPEGWRSEIERVAARGVGASRAPRPGGTRWLAHSRGLTYLLSDLHRIVGRGWRSRPKDVPAVGEPGSSPKGRGFSSGPGRGTASPLRGLHGSFFDPADWRLGDLVLGGASAIAVLSLLTAPWWLSGRLDQMAAALQALPNEPPRIDVSAYNLWYLLWLGRLGTSSLEQPLGLPITYQALGIALFGALALALALLAHHRTLMLPAAALSLGLFVSMTQMHERHMFPVLAFLILACAGRPRLWVVYAVLSATFFFNVVTVAPFTPLLGTNLAVARPDSIGILLLKGLSLLVAATNTVVLGWLLREVVKGPWRKTMTSDFQPAD